MELPRSFDCHILLKLAVFIVVTTIHAQNYSLQTLIGGPLVTEGSTALSAVLRYATALASDSSGNLLIADHEDNRIWKVDPTGAITTYAGDNGPSAQANLNLPSGVTIDSVGNTHIAENGNARIRLVTTDGVIQTIAGSGVGYPSNGDGSALLCNFNPYRIAIGTNNAIYVADWANNRVRLLTLSQ
jgi:hypothetical protein